MPGAGNAMNSAQARGLRNTHPLDAVNRVMVWMSNVLQKELNEQGLALTANVKLVPHALMLLQELTENVQHYKPMSGGPTNYTVKADVQTIDVDGGRECLEIREVDRKAQTCTCLKWQDSGFPCGCVSAPTPFSCNGEKHRFCALDRHHAGTPRYHPLFVQWGKMSILCT